MDIHPLDEDEMQAAWEAAGDADLDEINQLLVDYCSELIRELVRSQRTEVASDVAGAWWRAELRRGTWLGSARRGRARLGGARAGRGTWHCRAWPGEAWPGVSRARNLEMCDMTDDGANEVSMTQWQMMDGLASLRDDLKLRSQLCTELPAQRRLCKTQLAALELIVERFLAGR